MRRLVTCAATAVIALWVSVPDCFSATIQHVGATRKPSQVFGSLLYAAAGGVDALPAAPSAFPDIDIAITTITASKFSYNCRHSRFDERLTFHRQHEPTRM